MLRSGVIGVLALLAGTASAAASQQVCSEAPVAVQVLGSGGPFSRDGRASSSYLVWIDGRARVMVDVGGGAFVRFGESGARLEDLSLLAVSHFHPDHVADLPALLWMSQLIRTTPLPFAGPSGDDRFPGARAILGRLFGGDDGAFPQMSGVLDGGSPAVVLEPIEIDVQAGPAAIFESEDLRVRAIAVPHEPPSIAYRVDAGGVSAVFGTDQTGADPSFVEFARDADVLVLHLAVSETSTVRIHARPSVAGRLARQAGARTLILSHLSGIDPAHPAAGQFSLSDLDAALAAVRDAYSGRLLVAEDLMCTPVG
jgi:ribonuclease BN (tRNA processing enzyme)